MSSVLFLASARSEGNTRKVCQYLSETAGIPCIDFNDFKIAYYDYQHQYEADDFAKVIEQLLAFDTLILATPVYWYTMSAQMKTFLDRISDLLMPHNEAWLPQLTGKTIWTVAVGSEPTPTPHFFDPFRLSAEYLGMYYGGDLHTWLGRVPVMKPEVQPLLDAFAKHLKVRMED